VDWLLDKLFFLIPSIISLTFHEYAHAWSANRLGDRTAAEAGRLTLDPTVHIDPIGTVLLPLLGVPFGWAKPVPVRPDRFRRGVNQQTGMMWVAAAGPLANLLLAFVCGVTLAMIVAWVPSSRAPDRLLYIGMQMNIVLCLFNLLPIPPLDGSRIADRYMPASLREPWEKLQANAGIALIVLFVVMSNTTVDLFGWARQLAVAGVRELVGLLGG
jgi:Zn-dependent protease